MTDSNKPQANQLLQNSNNASNEANKNEENIDMKKVEIKEGNENKPVSDTIAKIEDNKKPEEPKIEELPKPEVLSKQEEPPKAEEAKIENHPKIEEAKIEQPPRQQESSKPEELVKTEVPNVENNQKIEKKNEIPKEIELKKDETNIEKFEDKKDQPNLNAEAINNENITQINHEASNPIIGGESNNILESNEIKDKQKEEQKDNNDIIMSNMEFNNFNNDVMEFNTQLMSKEFDKNSFTYSSSGGDPNKFLGRKRQFDKYEEELICREICEDKKSSPSLVMLCKIIEEFTFGTVLDTLLKSTLNQDSKLDSILQGLIDSEGINKVILMLLKFKQ